jgi:cyclohexyl-isocyanide hydratase
MLKDFGATPVAERVVRDRNRISGGGVTAGIDFGLTVAAELAGDEVAKSIQLVLEYDPQPPFDSGSPEKAGPERVKRIHERLAPLLESRRKANAEAAARLA